MRGVSTHTPSFCLHGTCAPVRPLPDCQWCGGSGRVPFESDEYPPGTNACCCTCSRCRQDAAAAEIEVPPPDPGYAAFAAVHADLTEEQRACSQGPTPVFNGETTYTHQDVCDVCLCTPGFCLCGAP